MKVTGQSDSNRVEHRSHVHELHSSKSELARERAQSKSTTGDHSGVRPEISAKGRELAHAKDVASKAPDVREEKIAKLKAMIAANQYKVDPHAVADRLVDEHLSSGIG